MVPTASAARTWLALGAAGTTIVAALVLHPRAPGPHGATAHADDGMQLTARLTSTRILAGSHDQHLAVAITAPAARATERPPLSLAVVIDRSGSMEGEPMQDAKAAAARLVSRLDANDAFAIVTYSSSDETVTAMARATDANKAAAFRAIARIDDDGGTCISCGLVRGATELARSPLHGGVRRIVLISDGQANEGIYDRDELAQLAADTAAQGTSISTVGVGLDFDEVTMTRLADVGRGNYHFVEDTRHLDAMFATELGALAETVAADVQLVLTTSPGVRVEEVYGYPITRAGDRVIVPIADLRAGEHRKVVLRVHVTAEQRGALELASVQLDWRAIIDREAINDGAARRATTAVRVEVVGDPARVAASVDTIGVDAVEQALSAKALEEASQLYDTHGAAAAQQVLQRRVDAVRANKHVGRDALRDIEAAAAEADHDFARAPSGGSAGAKAKKASRAKAYQLAK